LNFQIGYWFSDEKTDFFHFLGLFMAKKHDLSDKIIRSSCSIAGVAQNFEI
jgi:hypothetical protein